MLEGDDVFNKNKELGLSYIHRAACHKSPQGHMELMKHGYKGIASYCSDLNLQFTLTLFAFDYIYL
jgi:hypothetical protein